jgi:carbonic anhydrase
VRGDSRTGFEGVLTCAFPEIVLVAEIVFDQGLEDLSVVRTAGTPWDRRSSAASSTA